MEWIASVRILVRVTGCDRAESLEAFILSAVMRWTVKVDEAEEETQDVER